MKKKTGKTSRFLAMTLSFVLVMGLCFSGSAAREIRSGKRQENAQRLPGDSNVNVSPAPVIDDSPINPDTGGKKRPGDTLKQQRNPNHDNKRVPKKLNPHRLW
jgi:hypothetical protein